MCAKRMSGHVFCIAELSNQSQSIRSLSIPRRSVRTGEQEEGPGNVNKELQIYQNALSVRINRHI